MIVLSVLHGLIAIVRNALNTLYDIEGPWYLAAVGRRSLGSVPDDITN
jgi:hypothetical protein